MSQTLELLERALKQKSASDWARAFNISPSTFTNARKRGRLSPTLAGNIALLMGESAERWTATAAVEAEPNGPLKTYLIEQFQKMHKVYLPTLIKKLLGRTPAFIVQVLSTRIADTANSRSRSTVADIPNDSQIINRVTAS